MTAPAAVVATLYAVTSGKRSPAAKAIARCLSAYHRTLEGETTQGTPRIVARIRAKTAYKIAMPTMETIPDIRAYIACVAQGLNLDVFTGRDGSQMLYAAQVAMSLAKLDKPKEAQ